MLYSSEQMLLGEGLETPQQGTLQGWDWLFEQL